MKRVTLETDDGMLITYRNDQEILVRFPSEDFDHIYSHAQFYWTILGIPQREISANKLVTITPKLSLAEQDELIRAQLNKLIDALKNIKAFASGRTQNVALLQAKLTDCEIEARSALYGVLLTINKEIKHADNSI